MTSTRLRPLYIIPARGGSKGIPYKNIKQLGGRPLIAYSIDVALSLAGGNPERVILSTDDPKIASVAESLGLPVPYRRPASLATDTSGSREVIIDAMDYADSQGIGYDCVVLLQPTTPFRNAQDVQQALELFDPEDTDMVVSVAEAASNHTTTVLRPTPYQDTCTYQKATAC